MFSFYNRRFGTNVNYPGYYDDFFAYDNLRESMKEVNKIVHHPKLEIIWTIVPELFCF